MYNQLILTWNENAIGTCTCGAPAPVQVMETTDTPKGRLSLSRDVCKAHALELAQNALGVRMAASRG